jgi:hypothetical protein
MLDFFLAFGFALSSRVFVYKEKYKKNTCTYLDVRNTFILLTIPEKSNIYSKNI